MANRNPTGYLQIHPSDRWPEPGTRVRWALRAGSGVDDDVSRHPWESNVYVSRTQPS